MRVLIKITSRGVNDCVYPARESCGDFMYPVEGFAVHFRYPYVRHKHLLVAVASESSNSRGALFMLSDT